MIFSSVKSVWGNKACHIFITDFGGVKAYPLKNKGDDNLNMSQYFKDVGIPTYLHMYIVEEMYMSKKQNNVIAKYGGSKIIWTEPHTPQHNHIEK